MELIDGLTPSGAWRASPSRGLPRKLGEPSGIASRNFYAIYLKSELKAVRAAVAVESATARGKAEPALRMSPIERYEKRFERAPTPDSP